MNADIEVERCGTCAGSGEIGTDYGILDCPDCGGSGTLPSQKVMTEWRISDIERRAASGKPLPAEDVPWLLEELRRARSALISVVALAHDAEDEFGIDRKIRFTANSALGVYPRSRAIDEPQVQS